MRKKPLERSYDLEAKSRKQKTHRLITGFFVRFHCCDVSRTRSVAYSLLTSAAGTIPEPSFLKVSAIGWAVNRPKNFSKNQKNPQKQPIFSGDRSPCVAEQLPCGSGEAVFQQDNLLLPAVPVAGGELGSL